MSNQYRVFEPVPDYGRVVWCRVGHVYADINKAIRLAVRKAGEVRDARNRTVYFEGHRFEETA